MKVLKRTITVFLLIVLLLAAIFLAGRYGWKLCGFRACQGAGITSVEVDDKNVHITGFYPGSFPAGFCGYYAKEQYGKLYVGFRFSPLFGSFETGDFDIVIPVREEIDEVILKTSRMETSIWSTQNGFHLQEEQEDAYVKTEQTDKHSIFKPREYFTGSRVKNPDSYSLDIQRMNGTDLHTLELQKDDVLEISRL